MDDVPAVLCACARAIRNCNGHIWLCSRDGRNGHARQLLPYHHWLKPCKMDLIFNFELESINGKMTIVLYALACLLTFAMFEKFGPLNVLLSITAVVIICIYILLFNR